MCSSALLLSTPAEKKKSGEEIPLYINLPADEHEDEMHKKKKASTENTHKSQKHQSEAFELWTSNRSPCDSGFSRFGDQEPKENGVRFRRTTEKRVSAVAISRDELFVCFADKFGVVSVVSLEELNENVPLSNKKAVTILSHYCSIITSLEFSPDGRFIVSADRDFKIRVTVFPKNPLAGAHEIQSFCLGHSEYVSSLAFPQPDQSQNFLLSGSGDSTVRLWDIISGSLICTCHVGAKAGLSMESHPAVIDLCVAPKSSLVAVAIQGLQGVLLLTCDLSAKALSVIKVVSFSGETFIPTRLGTSSVAVAELLWMVSGVSSLPDFKASCLAQVKVASGFKKTVEEEEDERSSDHNVHELLTLLEDGDIPGGEKLLEELQGSVHIESNVISAAADAVRAAMSNLLVKKQYTVEKRDFRKRRRNDRKFKKR